MTAVDHHIQSGCEFRKILPVTSLNYSTRKRMLKIARFQAVLQFAGSVCGACFETVFITTADEG
jgi:hypothetical protein